MQLPPSVRTLLNSVFVAKTRKLFNFAQEYSKNAALLRQRQMVSGYLSGSYLVDAQRRKQTRIPRKFSGVFTFVQICRSSTAIFLVSVDPGS